VIKGHSTNNSGIDTLFWHIRYIFTRFLSASGECFSMSRVNRRKGYIPPLTPEYRIKEIKSQLMTGIANKSEPCYDHTTHFEYAIKLIIQFLNGMIEKRDKNKKLFENVYNSGYLIVNKPEIYLYSIGCLSNNKNEILSVPSSLYYIKDQHNYFKPVYSQIQLITKESFEPSTSWKVPTSSKIY
jgi:hypothetical protein